MAGNYTAGEHKAKHKYSLIFPVFTGVTLRAPVSTGAIALRGTTASRIPNAESN